MAVAVALTLLMLASSARWNTRPSPGALCTALDEVSNFTSCCWASGLGPADEPEFWVRKTDGAEDAGVRLSFSTELPLT